MKRFGFFVFTGVILVASVIVRPQPTYASNSDIISDGVFGNENAMSEGQINNFINAFPKSCLRPENFPAGLSPVTWKEPLGYFDYGNDTTPARIIWRAATLYHINPQVLLATLEKEQGLVSGNSTYGCTPRAYNSAMGYNCPDGSENALKDYPNIGVSRTCVARESNVTFSRQVNHAGWQLSFDAHRANGDLSWLGDGAVSYVGFMTQGNRARVQGGPVSYYDGIAIIDGTPIQLANGPTAALYNYTPHFNSFERIFTTWFGATHWTTVDGCSESTNTALVCVWKARNNATGVELITSDYNTIVSWVNGKGYSFIGKSFFGRSTRAPSAGNIPVYSLTQKVTGETFVTASRDEYNAIAADSSHWTADGIMFYADPAGSNTGYQVYRMYNPGTGQHTWTIYASDVASYKSAGFVNEGISFTSINPIRPETAAPDGQSNVYRFGGMPGNTHFWTKDIAERDRMIVEGYSYEGIAWRVTNYQTAVPIYRLYSPVVKRHLYSSDQNEVNKLGSSGMWNFEGIAWYGSTSGQPVYRLYSPAITAHLYTSDMNEINFWVGRGIFANEGVAWYQP